MNTDNGALSFDAWIDNSQFKKQIDEMNAKIAGLSKSAVDETTKMDQAFSKAGAAVAGYFSIQAISSFATELVRVTGQFQKYEAVLTNTFGSNEKAKESMQMLTEIAAKTPFQLDSLTDSYVKLVNRGIEPSQEQLIAFGDVAASTGKGFDQLTEAIMDISNSERWREMGIVSEKAGDKVKLTFKGVTKEVEHTVDGVARAITEFGKMEGVSGTMSSISATIEGQMSNFKDSWDQMLNNIGQDNAGFISDVIGGASYVVQHYQTILDIIVPLVAAYGAYKAVLITIAALQKAKDVVAYARAFMETAKALGVATAAQTAMNAATMTNVYIAAAVAIAALAAIVYKLATAESYAEETQNRYNDAIEESNDKITEEKSKISSLLTVINDETLSRDYRNQKLKELIALSDNHLNALTLDSLKTAEGKAAIDSYVESLEKKIRMQTLEAQLTESIKKMQDAQNGKENVTWWQKGLSMLSNGGMNSGQMIAGYSAENNAEVVAAEKKLQEDIKKQMQGVTGIGAGGSDAGGGSKNTKTVKQQIADNLKAQSEANAELKRMRASNSKATAADIEAQEKSIKELKSQYETLTGKSGKKGGGKSDAKKLLDDAEAERLAAQKRAYDADIALQRSQITDKKDLIDFDLKQTLKGIEDEKTAYLAKAKKAKIKNPDVSSFKAQADTATAQAEVDKQIIDKEQLKKDNAEVFEFAKKEYEQLLSLKEKYADDITKIEKEYNTEIEKLRKGGFEKEAQLAEGERDKKISDVNAGLLQETDAYKLATNDKLMASKATTEILIADIKARIQAEVAAGKISSDTAKKMLADIDAAQATVNGNKNQNNPFAQLGEAIKGNTTAQDNLNAAKANLSVGGISPKDASKALMGLEDAAASATASMAGAAGAALQGVGQILGSVVDGMDRLGMLTDEEKKDAENIIGMVSGAANLAMGIATGNPMAIIQGSIELVVNAFEYFDYKSKDIAKKQKALVKEVNSLKDAYDRLERAVSKAFSTKSAKLQQDEIKNLQAQIAANEEWIEQENRKKKKKRDQAAIEAKKKENEDLQNQITDTKDSIIEAMTGTSVMSAIDSFANAYADAFTSGENAAMKSAEVVRGILKSALVEKLKSDLQPGITELMNMISYAMSDGIITAEEKADIYAKNKENDAKAAKNQKMFDDLGLSDKTSKQALSGSIQNVSEETASVISGQMNAMRINQIESITVLRNQLIALDQIAANTSYNRFLESIDNRLSKLTSDTLRSSGL